VRQNLNHRGHRGTRRSWAVFGASFICGAWLRTRDSAACCSRGSKHEGHIAAYFSCSRQRVGPGSDRERSRRDRAAPYRSWSVGIVHGELAELHFAMPERNVVSSLPGGESRRLSCAEHLDDIVALQANGGDSSLNMGRRKDLFRIGRCEAFRCSVCR